MSTRVNIVSVDVINNPATFSSQFEMEITFEVFEYLPHDLEWTLVYVGSAESESYDQVLDSVLVGPIKEGRHRFADPPDPEKIPQSEIVGVTVILLNCSYNGQPFIKIGWYVANEYVDDELKENPPNKPLLDKLVRTVQTTDVRVTSFPIKWDDAETTNNQDDEAMSPVVEQTDQAVDEVMNGKTIDNLMTNSPTKSIEPLSELNNGGDNNFG